MKKTVIITGVTGFIGNALASFFLGKKYQVKGLSRHPGKTLSLQEKGLIPVYWDGRTPGDWEQQLEDADAVINLSGESIGSGRWSRPKKTRILNSRVNSGKVLSGALKHIVKKPGIYVQASAIGWYGNCGDRDKDETSPPGQGFLADVSRQWESASAEVDQLGIRRVICRFGMVLGRNQGALKRMLMPFRFFLGGPMGSGQQWVSWIHIDDVSRAVDFLISHQECRGIFNLTAPEPVRNREFSRSLGKSIHRPSALPIPAWILKMTLGEMAGQLLLSSQRIIPKRLSDAGFSFRYPYLEEALKDLFLASGS